MKALLFDTETTDLMPNSMIALDKRPYLIEFYGMILEGEGADWEKVSELEFLCKPPVRITEEITKITSITNEMVEDAPPFVHFKDDLALFIGEADIAVAHNLSFDMAVIDTEFARHQRGIMWPRQLICTVEATEHLRGHRLKLSALHEELFGEPFSGAHRARVDVEAMGRCWVELNARDEI